MTADSLLFVRAGAVLPSQRNLHEFETIDDARAAIAAYVSHYHHRPHSGLDYRTPKEVRQPWMPRTSSTHYKNRRPDLSTRPGALQ